MDKRRNRITQKAALVSVALFFTALASFAGTRKADLAGSWYTDSGPELLAELRGYLDAAVPPPFDGEIIAIMVPHAGYRFSGPVAAYGFKAVEGKKIDTVIVIGFSHGKRYEGVAVLDADAFETPLGKVGIDRNVTAELMKRNAKIYDYPGAFSEENSVEMEIPFLQAAFKDFKIVLIAMGDQSFENCRMLGQALFEVLKDKKASLLVASTDMCHYLPYGQANEIDGKTISIIKEFDPDKLYSESLISGHRLMCGYGAVCATMIAAGKLGANKAEILKYANSGDTAWDRRSVVGYLSAAFVKSTATPVAENAMRKKGDDNMMLSREQKDRLLKLARNSITHYLKTGKRLEVTESDPGLKREMGVFVTLHESGRLRGCIGNMVGRGPLYLTVRDMSVEAATGDPRFRPVTLDEMKDIDVEISVLSPMEKIKDPGEVEMGKHGVMVKSGFASGVYLPQVATETGWSREEFMNSLCGQKAGMPGDAWKKGKCDIYIFTAEVFGEKK